MPGQPSRSQPGTYFQQPCHARPRPLADRSCVACQHMTAEVRDRRVLEEQHDRHFDAELAADFALEVDHHHRVPATLKKVDVDSHVSSPHTPLPTLPEPTLPDPA